VTATGNGPAVRGGRRAVVLLLVPVVTLLLLVAAVVALVLRSSDRARDDDARTAAVAAARQEALNLTTLRYGSADADLDRIVGLSTGDLRRRFEAERAQLPGVLAQEKSESRGSVLSAGLVRLAGDGASAEAAVAVDAEVSTEATRSNGQPALKHYRMVMQLRLVDGHWLVSDVAFAGTPQ